MLSNNNYLKLFHIFRTIFQRKLSEINNKNELLLRVYLKKFIISNSFANLLLELSKISSYINN